MKERDEQFRTFVSERSAALLRLAYLLTADHAAAEDLLQTALLKMYPRWRRIDDPNRYVRRVLVTVAADEGRRAHRRRERVAADPPETVDLTDPFGQTDDRHRLLAALAELPAKQRAAVVLRHWLDLDPAAAAELLGCSPETVRSQTSRGLDKLRAALTETTSLTETTRSSDA